MHIHGEKFFTVFDNSDRAIVGDDEIERSMTKHRNLEYDDSFAPRGKEFHLSAGDGCYVPYQWPHWVRTSDTHSISLAITWKTREVRRLNDLQRGATQSLRRARLCPCCVAFLRVPHVLRILAIAQS